MSQKVYSKTFSPLDFQRENAILRSVFDDGIISGMDVTLDNDTVVVSSGEFVIDGVPIEETANDQQLFELDDIDTGDFDHCIVYAEYVDEEVSYGLEVGATWADSTETQPEIPQQNAIALADIVYNYSDDSVAGGWRVTKRTPKPGRWEELQLVARKIRVEEYASNVVKFYFDEPFVVGKTSEVQHRLEHEYPQPLTTIPLDTDDETGDFSDSALLFWDLSHEQGDGSSDNEDAVVVYLRFDGPSGEAKLEADQPFDVYQDIDDIKRTHIIGIIKSAGADRVFHMKGVGVIPFDQTLNEGVLPQYLAELSSTAYGTEEPVTDASIDIDDIIVNANVLRDATLEDAYHGFDQSTVDGAGRTIQVTSGPVEFQGDQDLQRYDFENNFIFSSTTQEYLEVEAASESPKIQHIDKSVLREEGERPYSSRDSDALEHGGISHLVVLKHHRGTQNNWYKLEDVESATLSIESGISIMVDDGDYLNLPTWDDTDLIGMDGMTAGTDGNITTEIINKTFFISFSEAEDPEKLYKVYIFESGAEFAISRGHAEDFPGDLSSPIQSDYTLYQARFITDGEGPYIPGLRAGAINASSTIWAEGVISSENAMGAPDILADDQLVTNGTLDVSGALTAAGPSQFYGETTISDLTVSSDLLVQSSSLFTDGVTITDGHLNLGIADILGGARQITIGDIKISPEDNQYFTPIPIMSNYSTSGALTQGEYASDWVPGHNEMPTLKVAFSSPGDIITFMSDTQHTAVVEELRIRLNTKEEPPPDMDMIVHIGGIRYNDREAGEISISSWNPGTSAEFSDNSFTLRLNPNRYDAGFDVLTVTIERQDQDPSGNELLIEGIIMQTTKSRLF